MYTVVMSISDQDGFLSDAGRFRLEFPDVAQFRTTAAAVKAIKLCNIANRLEEFTTFKVIENYGFDTKEVVQKFTVILKQVLV